jgi:hypothetical protein
VSDNPHPRRGREERAMSDSTQPAAPEQEADPRHVAHRYYESMRAVMKQRDALVQERDRLRTALVEVEHLARQSRVWGGMRWTYGPLRAGVVERINETVNAALAPQDGAR